MIEIEFIGAAQTVTGSKHLVRTSRATVLLDCGLYQGRRHESIERNQNLGVAAHTLDAVVLSHAHIDHSGALPILARSGFDGSVYATPATRDLCAVMLEDAAHIQAADARYINKQIDRGDETMERVEPLYSEADVLKVLNQIISVPYHRRIDIAPGVTLTFLDAGHVLGSAITLLDVDDEGETRRLVFTGDLGRTRLPILRDPEIADSASILITESTYGDRTHPPVDLMVDQLATVLKRTYERGGKVVIPSFALERAQEVVFALKKLKKKGAIPDVPVFVDSPLTVRITDVFKLHPECYDAETRALMRGADSPFDFSDLTYVEDKEGSKSITASHDPAIVISASGMCEAGRVLHHLRDAIGDPKNTVLIVGYQAQHTLGRRLVEKKMRVRIFGVERERRCDVVVLNGFSAHADQKDLVEYAAGARKKGSVDKIFLVHGDPQPQKVLKEKLEQRGLGEVFVPGPGERLEG